MLHSLYLLTTLPVQEPSRDYCLATMIPILLIVIMAEMLVFVALEIVSFRNTVIKNGTLKAGTGTRTENGKRKRNFLVLILMTLYLTTLAKMFCLIHCNIIHF